MARPDLRLVEPDDWALPEGFETVWAAGVLKLEDWESRRDAGIAPAHESTLGGSLRSRREFLLGARMLGFDNERRPLAPQQLRFSDVLDGAGGQCGALLPRRSAKTTSLNEVALGRAAVREDYRIGLLTLTTGKAGRARFLKDVAPVLERRFPDYKTGPLRVFKAAGQERVEFRESGSIVAWLSSIEDMRGERFDLLIFDEAGEPEPEKAEDALAAGLPTLDTSPDGQLVAAGTAGRYRDGNPLWGYLKAGRDGLGGILEYAGADSLTVEDIDTWDKTEALILAHHPGVNTLTTLDAIKRNWLAMKREQFLREYLGIFGVEGAGETAIRWELWERLARPVPKDRLPKPPERFGFALAVHFDQLAASYAAAWRDESGRPHGLVIKQDEGVRWVREKGEELWAKYRMPLAYKSTGPVVAETEHLARKRVRLEKQSLLNVTTAAALLFKEIESGRFVHYDQPALNEAVRRATKQRLLGAWAFGSVEDITALEAVALALRQFDELKPKSVIRPNF